MTGAKPVYIPTDRNALGLIGEMDPNFLSEEKFALKLLKLTLKKLKLNVHLDWLSFNQRHMMDSFYDAKWMIDKIGKLCDYILLIVLGVDSNSLFQL